MKILKRMNKSNNRKNSGFTLVELVIVMAIMEYSDWLLQAL